MKPPNPPLALVGLLGLLPACQHQAPPPKQTSVPVSQSVMADQWLGQWNGPEGTFVVLSKEGAKYAIKINSLDGPATFEATPVANGLEFQRDGKTESIRAGDGNQTGMKYLLGKKNCLVIKSGEGFCRD